LIATAPSAERVAIFSRSNDMAKIWTKFNDGDVYPNGHFSRLDDEKLAEMHRETRETATEMCAILDDDETQPGIVEAYRPPHNPVNDNEMTRVDLPAIGGGE
jgi:hypothetical protein